jgi:hypothetical protein
MSNSARKAVKVSHERADAVRRRLDGAALALVGVAKGVAGRIHPANDGLRPVALGLVGFTQIVFRLGDSILGGRNRFGPVFEGVDMPGERLVRRVQRRQFRLAPPGRRRQFVPCEGRGCEAQARPAGSRAPGR